MSLSSTAVAHTQGRARQYHRPKSHQHTTEHACTNDQAKPRGCAPIPFISSPYNRAHRHSHQQTNTMRRAPTAKERARQTRPKEEGLNWRSPEEQQADEEADDLLNHPRDVTTGSNAVQPPYVFREESFARHNIQVIAEYAGYRALGVNAERAFLRTFGTDYADIRLSQRIDALEHNIVYRKVFIEQFAKVKLGEMWDVKMAAWEFLQLINNPFVKDSTRLSAIKEMNVLFNITMVDPDGRTRAGKGLKEFYESVKGSEAPTVAVAGIRHPEPGTPEAEALIASREAQTGAS